MLSLLPAYDERERERKTKRRERETKRREIQRKRRRERQRDTLHIIISGKDLLTTDPMVCVCVCVCSMRG